MLNVFDELITAQKRGEAKGITSVCSAHPYVIGQTLRVSKTLRVCPLIETTCNQVNQFGGYPGMTPKDFVSYIGGMAIENDFLFDIIVFAGNHFGPNVARKKSASSSCDK